MTLAPEVRHCWPLPMGVCSPTLSAQRSAIHVGTARRSGPRTRGLATIGAAPDVVELRPSEGSEPNVAATPRAAMSNDFLDTLDSAESNVFGSTGMVSPNISGYEIVRELGR